MNVHTTAVKHINIRLPLALKKRLSDESARQTLEVPGDGERISVHTVILEACELYLEMTDEERGILRDRAQARKGAEQ